MNLAQYLSSDWVEQQRKLIGEFQIRQANKNYVQRSGGVGSRTEFTQNPLLHCSKC